MKRTLLSLVTVLAVVAASAGATFAYFADLAASEGNSFRTGTVDIEIGSTFEETGMYPGGDERISEETVYNEGTLPFDYRITAQWDWENGDNFMNAEGLYGALQLKVDTGNGTPVLYNGNLSDLDLIRESIDAGGFDDLRFRAWLPETGEDQSILQGSTTVATFTFEARTEGGFEL